MQLKSTLALAAILFGSLLVHSQKNDESLSPTLVVTGNFLGERPSIADQITSGEFIPAFDKKKVVNSKKAGANKAVPGKGMPKGGDPLMGIQMDATKMPATDPIITWECASSNTTPTDPTGAVGPNHYMNSWNSSFRIWDKDGNALTFAASLATIWPGQNAGDPIVMYDAFADRFVITQFSFSNSFLVAISQGPDPVNDGWWTYEFDVNSFPDYPKYSVWSDGYYVTANKNSNNAGNTEVVYAMEREKMLEGDPSAQMVGFPLPGITTSGFYSPLGFNANGSTMPPVGNAPICYMQDDSWGGVNDDHLKIWNINVNWDNPGASDISSAQEVMTEDFDGLFDGGSFSNLPQPNGVDADCLQATVMYMAQYMRFGAYNGCVVNWVVDLDGGDDYAGIRWIELRQDGDGEDWYIYQEGTYIQPDGLSAFCGSIAYDVNGNIGLGYSVVSEDEPIGLRFTGRYASDPLGEMTLEEGIIADGVQSTGSFRYGDYSQLTLDPADGCTFWFVGEHFNGGSRKNTVGAFKLGSLLSHDVGVIAITSPVTGLLTATETVTVSVRNFGLEDQTNFPISYSVDGGIPETELFTGTLPAGETQDFSFAASADLSTENETYEIWASTELISDENLPNDPLTIEVTHLEPNDIGVIAITSPFDGMDIGNMEDIVITIENFGSADQSNFDVQYTINGGAPVIENVAGPVMGQSTLSYTFNEQGTFEELGDYDIWASTSLPGDIDTANDPTEVTVTKEICSPEADCSLGDGIIAFELELIDNNSGCDDGGYGDYTNMSTGLSAGTTHTATLTTGWGSQFVKSWIDLNDNYLFENSEVIINDFEIAAGEGEGSYTENIDYPVPGDAAIGQHLMRVKTNWNDDVPDDPCEDTNYGETEDYTVEIGATDIDANPFGENELIVATMGGNNFNFSLYAPSVPKYLIFQVRDIQGKLIVENKVYPNGGHFQYELDMSHAASGNYLVKMGTYDYGKVSKIVVQ